MSELQESIKRYFAAKLNTPMYNRLTYAYVALTPTYILVQLRNGVRKLTANLEYQMSINGILEISHTLQVDGQSANSFGYDSFQTTANEFALDQSVLCLFESTLTCDAIDKFKQECDQPTYVIAELVNMQE